jgi:lipopolysaccharide assembly protein A
MQFLKTLFWVVVAIALTLFAIYNWRPVTLNLWSGLQADVKLPVLVAIPFLLGFLPTYFVYRGRLWALRHRYERPERVSVGNQPAETPAPAPTAVTGEDPSLAI